jgi:hypothetical protein
MTYFKQPAIWRFLVVRYLPDGGVQDLGFMRSEYEGYKFYPLAVGFCPSKRFYDTVEECLIELAKSGSANCAAVPQFPAHGDTHWHFYDVVTRAGHDLIVGMSAAIDWRRLGARRHFIDWDEIGALLCDAALRNKGGRAQIMDAAIKAQIVVKTAVPS